MFNKDFLMFMYALHSAYIPRLINCMPMCLYIYNEINKFKRKYYLVDKFCLQQSKYLLYKQKLSYRDILLRHFHI